MWRDKADERREELQTCQSDRLSQLDDWTSPPPAGTSESDMGSCRWSTMTELTRCHISQPLTAGASAEDQEEANAMGRDEKEEPQTGRHGRGRPPKRRGKEAMTDIPVKLKQEKAPVQATFCISSLFSATRNTKMRSWCRRFAQVDVDDSANEALQHKSPSLAPRRRTS
jgi:hypothetical protein